MNKAGQQGSPPADICMIVEGAFPYVAGGVSSWIVDLLSGLPDLTFHIVAIKPENRPVPWRIDPPANVTGITEIALQAGEADRPLRAPRAAVRDMLAALETLILEGNLAGFARLVHLLEPWRGRISAAELLADRDFFAGVQRVYARVVPGVSFHQFFWAWRVLTGGALSMLLSPLPAARVYHAVSTGFAGLYAARARVAVNRPTVLTEHGIYQIEREIEIMMAPWAGEHAAGGLAVERPSRDVRDIWLRAFQGYADICYQASDPIIALYEANNRIQHRLGARSERLLSIPNGVRAAHFAALAPDRNDDEPRIALIGRVVPIKDIKTYIRACALVHQAHPHARFYVLGPHDEDADYAGECRALVTAHGLDEVFTFTGKVKMEDWLPRLDLIVLTSLSEAQPLVILEAGAAGIPVVSSDVGCCRELLEDDGAPEVAGGIITPLVNPDGTAAAISRLIANPALRTAMGAALQERIARRYDRAQVIARYRDLYIRLGAQD